MHMSVRLGMIDRPAMQAPRQLVRHGARLRWERALQPEHDGRRGLSSLHRRVNQWNEVGGVLRDDDSIFHTRVEKHLVVGSPHETEVANVARLMAQLGQVLRDAWAEHLVDQEPHEAKKRSRSPATRSASCSASLFRPIICSTSSGWDAAKEIAMRTSRSGMPS